MKRNIMLIWFIVILLQRILYAGFIDLGQGTRPIGMGHTFVGNGTKSPLN